MGPDAEMLELARRIKANWPDFKADEYALAYFLQSWCEEKEAQEPARWRMRLRNEAIDTARGVGRGSDA